MIYINIIKEVLNLENLNELTKEENPEVHNSYILKMRGGSRPTFEKIHFKHHLITCIGSFVGIGLVAILNYFYNLPLLIPSLGASAVLLYAACHTPMSQPRNVIGGHMVSAASGVLIYQLLGNHWWTIALGVTLAIFLMSVTHTLHPPGGATAFIAVYTDQSFSFIFSPVGLGALLLVLVAVVVNNFSTERKYPDFWF